MNCDTCGIEIEPDSLPAAPIAVTCGDCWAAKDAIRAKEAMLIHSVFLAVYGMRGILLTDAECAKIIAAIDAERGNCEAPMTPKNRCCGTRDNR